MIPIIVYLALLFASGFSAAGASHSTSVTVFSKKGCTTGFGPTRVAPLPRTTSEYITNTHETVLSTTTPSTTITPRTSTSSITKTVFTTSYITNPTITDTLTVTTTTTITDVGTTTDTSTITIISSITTTSTLATVTTSEPAGFTPIALEPAVVAAGGGKNLPQKQKRQASSVSQTSTITAAGTSSYPSAVTCHITYSSATFTFITTTARTTTFTAPTPTVTTTLTETDTITSTILPSDASTTTTITVSTTTDITQTVSTVTTTTISTTTTSYAPAPTIYEVCEDTQNFIDYVGANNIDTADGNIGHTLYASAKTPYDCCNACQELPNCGASTFLDVVNICYLLPYAAGGTCDATQEVGYFYTGNATANDGQLWTVTNGNCGQALYLGED